MTYEDDRNEGEIRRRAAWLLGMLAVVAALVVVLMVFLLGNSTGSTNNANPDPNYGNPTTAAVQSGSPTGSPSSSPSGGTTSGSSGSGSASSATSSGPVPQASCPSNSTCTVQGDLAGTIAAINQLRAQHGLSAVQAAQTGAAQQCALSSGSDCPQSYVWVHVDNLSGSAVVTAVEGFSGTDNLLDAGAKQFAIGWAYDPGSDSSYAAVIRVS